MEKLLTGSWEVKEIFTRQSRGPASASSSRVESVHIMSRRLDVVNVLRTEEVAGAQTRHRDVIR